MTTRRSMLALLGAGLPAVGISQTGASSYPNRAIRLVIPYAVGGATDITGRLIADELGRQLKAAVIVDNKSGAGGQIGLEYLAKSAPDGYTIGITTPATTAGPFVTQAWTLDAMKDFTPIALAVEAPLILVAHPSVPFTTIHEMIAYAKAHPGKLNIGTTGGSMDLTIGVFASMAGIKMESIPYKGSGPLLTALQANEIQLLWDQVASSKPLADAGRLKILAVGTTVRSPLLPDTPTVSESGLSGFTSFNPWFGIEGPAGLPASVVKTISDAMQVVLKQPNIASRFSQLGFSIVAGSPQDFQKAKAKDVKDFSEGVRLTGFKPL